MLVQAYDCLIPVLATIRPIYESMTIKNIRPTYICIDISSKIRLSIGHYNKNLKKTMAALVMDAMVDAVCS